METFNFSPTSFERLSSSQSEGVKEKSTWHGKVNDIPNASVLDLHLPKKRKLEVTPPEPEMYFTSKQEDYSSEKDFQFKRQSKNLEEFIRKYHDDSNFHNVLPRSDSCESRNEERISRKIQCLQREVPIFSSSLLTSNGLNNHRPGTYIGVEPSHTQFPKHGSFSDVAPLITPFSNVPSLQNTAVHSAPNLVSTLKRYSLPLATSITSCSEPNLQHATPTLWRSGETSLSQHNKLSDKDFSRLIGSVDPRGSNPSDHQEEVEAEINKLKGKLADFIMKQNLLQSSVLEGDNCSSNGDEESQDVSQERRKKNNEAAKRSRDARRLKEDETALRAGILEVENYQLRMELIKWQRESARLNNIAQMINR